MNKKAKKARSTDRNTAPKQSKITVREMTLVERIRLASIVQTAGIELGRDIEFEDISCLGMHPIRPEVFFMVKGHLPFTLIIRTVVAGKDYVVGIYSGMVSISGQKGLLIIGREFPHTPTEEEVALIVENEWNPSFGYTSSVPMTRVA